MTNVSEIKKVEFKSDFAENLFFAEVTSEEEAAVRSLSQYAVFPGFCDVHVHFREPGFSYKETIATGSKAAAKGGYTSVCTMPNLNPVPDSLEHLKEQTDIIERDAVIEVLPYAAITIGEKGEELVDMESLADKVIAFSDDGRGVQSEEMMREAMKRAKALDKMIVAHCEVNELLKGGYIHEGEYAKANGHRGICSESEWKQIERDLRLAKETGCAYHVCHISTKESVEIIRKAKAEGVNVTCETGPHYLVMDDSDLQEEGRFKMNPPLRSKADREALIEGIKDGTIDMIATDHAPHSAEEKSKGLEKSPFGITGIETCFPVVYTKLVKTGVITLEKAMELLVFNARKRFGISLGNDFTVWDLNALEKVEPEKFISMGKATPFKGWELFGKCLLTVKNGKIVYK
ncbi:MAG: dihydroorotase [Oscillospiraceae bacterium]|nr:dihydroorotase [Oscillospiraceae bacterium]MBQ2998594.1 dihydroorotase [Oscillospiraceae bacterium]MBQ6700100.1 dihydroorotase [Oscillospiraceae bacterium]